MRAVVLGRPEPLVARGSAYRRVLRSCLSIAPLSLVVAAQPGCSPAPDPEQPTPVLLIVADTLRSDRLGAYGYDRGTSRSIDALAASGITFRNAQSTSSWTVPSFGSILTGSLPSQHGAGAILRRDGKIVLRDGFKVFHRMDDDLLVLPEVLKQAGYRTGAILNNPFLEENMGLSRGFDDYELLPARENAKDVTNRAIEWMAAHHGSPFFLLVHYMDTHTPYLPPPEDRRRYTVPGDGRYPVSASSIWSQIDSLSREEKRFVSSAYDEEVYALDREVGRLLAELAELDPEKRTLIIFTSDHGEELFEHGGFEHGHSLHTEVMSVPLIMAGAGLTPRQISTPVSLLDIPATVLDATGLDAPDFAGRPGRSLWPRASSGIDDSPRDIIAEGTLYGRFAESIVDWPFKLIVTDGEPSRLYDIAADRGESRDLTRTHDLVMQKMRLALDEVGGREKQHQEATTEVLLYPIQIDELQALGYLEVH